jgi:hypothetical protein
MTGGSKSGRANLLQEENLKAGTQQGEISPSWTTIQEDEHGTPNKSSSWSAMHQMAASEIGQWRQDLSQTRKSKTGSS